jgi:hypothetical protein
VSTPDRIKFVFRSAGPDSVFVEVEDEQGNSLSPEAFGGVVTSEDAKGFWSITLSAAVEPAPAGHPDELVEQAGNRSEIWQTSTATFWRDTVTGQVFDLQPDEEYPALPADATRLVNADLRDAMRLRNALRWWKDATDRAHDLEQQRDGLQGRLDKALTLLEPHPLRNAEQDHVVRAALTGGAE